MTLIQALFLGLLQGLTEFLPVSSSGHLVIAQSLFNLGSPPVVFDILVHLATASAVIILLWPEILKLNFKTIRLIIIATLPAAFIGFFLNRQIETLFSSLTLVGLALIFTAGLLFSTRLFKKPQQPLNSQNALFIGLLQALAIIPGISRSGSTITAGLYAGLKPQAAFNFSFLLSLPAIFGAQLLQLKHLSTVSISQAPHYLIGFISAFVSGFIALKLLRKIVIKAQLHRFGYYCLTLGILVLLLL